MKGKTIETLVADYLNVTLTSVNNNVNNLTHFNQFFKGWLVSFADALYIYIYLQQCMCKYVDLAVKT